MIQSLQKILILLLIFIIMGIKRKVRMCGKSLAITIPRQIAELHGIREGDYMEFEPIGTGEFKIRKVKE